MVRSERFGFCIFVFALGAAFALLGFSCSKEAPQIQPTRSTVRGEVLALAGTLEWAEELNPDGIPPKPLLEGDLLLPQALAAVPPQGEVFPQYADFAVLDTRELDASALDLLDKFFAKAALPKPAARQVPADSIDGTFPFLRALLQESFAQLHDVEECLYGKPHRLESGWQIPVRLCGKSAHTDLQVFIRPEKGAWLIEQIYFGEAANE